MNLEGSVLLRNADDLKAIKVHPTWVKLLGGSSMEPTYYPCLLVRECPHCKRVRFLYHGDLKELANTATGYLQTMLGKGEVYAGTYDR